MFDSFIYRPPPYQDTGRIDPYLQVCPDSQIPYLVNLRSGRPLLFYLHANSEDASSCVKFVRELGCLLEWGWVIVQYPGYSVYKKQSDERTSKLIQQDCVKIFDRFKQDYKIIILGRSLGSGPALWLATVRNPHLLVLLSPFLSIKKVVRNHYGLLASWLVQQQFDNQLRAKDVSCQTLLVHGVQDQQISSQHSKQLINRLDRGVRKRLELLQFCDHFNIGVQLLSRLISSFLQQ